MMSKHHLSRTPGNITVLNVIYIDRVQCSFESRVQAVMLLCKHYLEDPSGFKLTSLMKMCWVEKGENGTDVLSVRL